jgi:hypothetical protein
LFNVMMNEMPSTHGVSVAEYTDNITFFVSHPNIQVASNLLQAQIDSFVDWTLRWGLKIKSGKNQNYVLHHQKSSHSSHPSQWTQSGICSATQVPWCCAGCALPHIVMLKTSCLPVLNLLKSISQRHWGADHQTLVKLYKILLHTKLDYTSPCYASAAQSHLSKLNMHQNSSLRIATGCRKTTPITTLDIETNIPPLKIHRDQLMCGYYSRLWQLLELLEPPTSSYLPGTPVLKMHPAPLFIIPG